MTYNIHTSIEAHITMITSVWRRSDFDDMKSITFARFNPNLFTRYYIITNSNLWIYNIRRYEPKNTLSKVNNGNFNYNKS